MNHVRALLDQRLSAVLARNAQVSPRLRQVQHIPADWGERTVQLTDADVLAGLGPEARAEIMAIRAALERVDAGTYGLCARCGAPVGEARLRVLPLLLTCVTCTAL